MRSADAPSFGQPCPAALLGQLAAGERGLQSLEFLQSREFLQSLEFRHWAPGLEPPTAASSCLPSARPRGRSAEAEEGGVGFLRRLCFGNSRYFFFSAVLSCLSKSRGGQRGLTTASVPSPEGAMDFSALRVWRFCTRDY